MNDDKYQLADRTLACLRHNVSAGSVTVAGSVYGVPDPEWNTEFYSRPTQIDAACMALIQKYRVCLNFYPDHVTANAHQTKGASVRYSMHKSDELAVRYAVVCAVIKLLESTSASKD
jgi:hypothetical protein